MPSLIRANTYQHAAGAPLQVAATLTWDKDAWALENDFNYGVTATPTPPTTLGGFAFVETGASDRLEKEDRELQIGGVFFF